MQKENIKTIIGKSKKILLTTHCNADEDAIGSSLFLYSVIRENLSVDVQICIEGKIPKSYNFLQYFDQIDNKTKVKDKISEYLPDLIIITDTTNFFGVTKDIEEAREVTDKIEKNKINVVIIDHHATQNIEANSIYFNNSRSSASEEVFMIIRELYNLQFTKMQKECIMFGILGDTNRFLYKNKYHRDTFNTISEFIESGLSVEVMQRRINTYTKTHTTIISELLKNFDSNEDYNFSYLGEDFVNRLRNDPNFDEDIYKVAIRQFLDIYIRNLYPWEWGFVIMPDIRFKEGFYKGSFRAQANTYDTTVFAEFMGGGGHKEATGFNIKANSISDAIEIVKKVIADNKQKARM